MTGAEITTLKKLVSITDTVLAAAMSQLNRPADSPSQVGPGQPQVDAYVAARDAIVAKGDTSEPAVIQLLNTAEAALQAIRFAPSFDDQYRFSYLNLPPDKRD